MGIDIPDNLPPRTSVSSPEPTPMPWGGLLFFLLVVGVCGWIGYTKFYAPAPPEKPAPKVVLQPPEPPPPPVPLPPDTSGQSSGPPKVAKRRPSPYMVRAPAVKPKPKRAPRAVKYCGRCNGLGAKVCPTCGGKGVNVARALTVTCVSCNGLGATPCHICHAKRKRAVVCPHCNRLISPGERVCENGHRGWWSTTR
jgi:hypothetical protein